MIYVSMCLVYEILLCIDPSAATPGNAREISKGRFESEYDIHFDIECAEALRYYYASIHLPLHLEVLAKFGRLRVSM